MTHSRAFTTLITAILGLVLVQSARPAAAQGLVVDGAGNVGVGTSTPTQRLDVRGKLSVEATLMPDLLSLTNTGDAASMTLASNQATWIVRNHGNGRLRLREAAGATAFELTSAGNLTIAGTLTQGSSRAIKSDIEPVDDRAVLSKVLSLPIYQWRYTADEDRVRQVGPMAEDFHHAFGLGDDAHISVGSANGVSISAIRGLNQRLEEKSAELEGLVATKQSEIDALRTENAQFAERLASLERRISENR